MFGSAWIRLMHCYNKTIIHVCIYRHKTYTHYCDIRFAPVTIVIIVVSFIRIDIFECADICMCRLLGIVYFEFDTIISNGWYRDRRLEWNDCMNMLAGICRPHFDSIPIVFVHIFAECFELGLAKYWEENRSSSCEWFECCFAIITRTINMRPNDQTLRHTAKVWVDSTTASSDFRCRRLFLSHCSSNFVERANYTAIVSSL